MKQKIYLCFDIGATTTKVAGLSYDDLKILFRDVFNTKKDNQLFMIEYLKQEVWKTINKYLLSHNVIAVGVSSCGAVDADSNVICHSNRAMVGYLGTNWKKMIDEEYHLPCVVVNDVKAAGIAELADRDVSSGVMITLGTGVAAALFINKQLYMGFNACAGEVGQMVWPYDNSQIVDVACSAVVATDKIKKIIGDDSFKLTDFQKIADNPVAIKVKTQWMQNVASILEFLDYFYDPELFIVGGGVSKHPELVHEIVNFLPMNFKRIEVAKNGNDAAFYGVIKQLKQTYNI